MGLLPTCLALSTKVTAQMALSSIGLGSRSVDLTCMKNSKTCLAASWSHESMRSNILRTHVRELANEIFQPVLRKLEEPSIGVVPVIVIVRALLGQVLGIQHGCQMHDHVTIALHLVLDTAMDMI